MRTVFLRLLEAEDKAAALVAAVREPAAPTGRRRFEVDPTSFAAVPRSPFAYWVGDEVRRLFAELTPFEAEGRAAKQGLATADDFRFVRLTTEVPTPERGRQWFPFAKGGAFSRYRADVHLVVNWHRVGAQIRSNVNDRGTIRSNVWMLRDTATHFFFRPGLTWPRRTQGGLSFRAMPAGCIFADKGPAAFADGDDPVELLALLALGNSRPFRALVEAQMAFGSYEVGVIQRTPVPPMTPGQRDELAALARRGWSLKRVLDTVLETSHAFLLPALLQAPSAGTDGEADPSLAGRARAWAARAAAVEAELDALQAEVDDRCFTLYGLPAEERQRIERGFGSEPAASSEDDDDDGDALEVDAAPLVASLLAWAVGVAYGRFDLRLATGDRAVPPEPEPFDPLPTCAPGMLSGNDRLPAVVPPPGYPVAFPPEGILVDDPGHPRDLTLAVRTVLDLAFEAPDARRHEAVALLGAADLREWLNGDLFPRHIKRYSKSRRKAPIYWQLATPSASYSVWLYYHRFTRDTMFQVKEYADLKVQHEEKQLAGLRQEAGAEPMASQRREIEEQESFVEELRAFRQEVARVAPLWNPDLNDGVIINFAPLWRLVPQHRQWQKECKSCWDKLVAGEYDWAHLAMHLWPERVVPRCADDRSLAIAHDLEEELWEEDEDGKWSQRQVSDALVQELIGERTSPAVKAALADLLTAPPPAGSRSRRRSPPRSTSRTRKPKPEPKEKASQRDTPQTREREDTSVFDAVRKAIATAEDGASRADVLDATAITATQWNTAIRELLDAGEVEKTGAKRGTRYHLRGGS